MPRPPAHPVRFRTALALALLSLVGAAGASAPFKSPDGSFTVTCPDGWSVVKPPPAPMAMLLVKGQPPRGRPPEGGPLIFATREKVTGRPTLDQLEEKTLAAFKENYPDAQIVSADPAKQGGEPARRITMKGRGRLGGAEVVNVTVVCLHGDATYSLGCLSAPEDSDRHAADLDKVVASLRFGDVRAKDDAGEKEKKPPDDNKLPFVAVKLLAVAGAPAAKDAARPAPGDTATFNDDEHHLRFRYPAAWKKEQLGTPGEGAVAVAGLLPNLPAPEGKIETHAFVQLHQADKPLKESTIGSFAEGIAKGVQKLDPSMKVTESGPATLGGHAGRRVVLTGTMKGAPCAFIAIATIRGGKAYSIGALCDPEYLPKLKADLQSIADSFQWTDAAPPAKSAPTPAPRRKAPA
jgi:hypothetical protein